MVMAGGRIFRNGSADNKKTYMTNRKQEIRMDELALDIA
jgi:hypothetical protein